MLASERVHGGDCDDRIEAQFLVSWPNRRIPLQPAILGGELVLLRFRLAMLFQELVEQHCVHCLIAVIRIRAGGYRPNASSRAPTLH